jgi:glycosyltransferase involved in cell wall biosynthesis
MSFSANLSVVTYTFNDAALARGLLESVAGWTVRPREIIAVDDGSSEAFHPPATAPEVKLLRLDPNRGATQAKQAGLDAATSKFILSVDADVRLSPDWAEKALPHAAASGTGMVSSSMRYDSGRDALSRYMALVYGYRPAPGATGYIPGPVWLMRQEVWRELGGFSGHREPIGEDSYLCARLRQAGRALVIAGGVEARQIRRLSRPAMVKRAFTWYGSHLREQLAKGVFLGEVMGVFLFALSKRVPARIAVEPVFAYFDLLYAAHGLLSLAAHGEPSLAGDLRAALGDYLGGYPKLAELLSADLESLGHAPIVAGDRAGTCANLIATLANIFTPPLLRGLEDGGLAEIADEDANADFSFYME